MLTAICCWPSPGNVPAAAALHTEAINQHRFYDLHAHSFTAKKSLQKTLIFFPAREKVVPVSPDALRG